MRLSLCDTTSYYFFCLLQSNLEIKKIIWSTYYFSDFHHGRVEKHFCQRTAKFEEDSSWMSNSAILSEVSAERSAVTDEASLRSVFWWKIWRALLHCKRSFLSNSIEGVVWHCDPSWHSSGNHLEGRDFFHHQKSQTKDSKWVSSNSWLVLRSCVDKQGAGARFLYLSLLELRDLTEKIEAIKPGW